MTNIKKYQNAFVESLDMKLEDVVNASVENVETWDSIGQMSLVAVLEETFSIEFQPDDMINFDSYSEGIELLRKYGVEL
ncbi:phosphopantetheine-binding protein [Bacteroides sp. OttesenSCG-928-D19]|nr:phosphopantetheine-binding protein [Bacteroides sp. OttesenSCG-928-D19]